MDLQSAIYHYCNYQERCHQEVRNKLYQLGADKEEVEQYLTEMIERGIVNEGRYAESFVRTRFGSKSWGRNRIIQQLKAREITDYLISKALKQIDIEQYGDRINKLALKKWEENMADKIIIRIGKVQRYLLQKGYELCAVQDAIQLLKDNLPGQRHTGGPF